MRGKQHMKLKRIAVVAAAAMVGPTVLMATPAMADEVANPAITTPDAAPKDDTAPATGEATGETTGTPAPEARKPGSAEQPQAPEAQQPQQQQPAEGAAAEKKAAEQVAVAGPKLTLDGLPAAFTAGGGWSQFSLHVDNSGRPAVDDHSLELVLWTLDTFGWESGDIQAEIYAPDSKGTWGWHAVEAYGSEEVYSFGLADVDVEKNEVFDLKIRMKFGKDAPVGKIFAVVLADDHGVDHIASDVAFAYSSINPASTGNRPTPDGVAEPIVDGNGNGTGTGTGSNTGTGTGTTSTTGGQLAETGSDAATSWALGGAGVALATGAALVAGTGRRRRPTA